MTDREVQIAWHRFGLGPTPSDQPPADARTWLEGQFGRYRPRPQSIAALPGSATIAAELFERLDMRRTMRRAARTADAAAASQPTAPVAAGIGPMVRRHLIDAIGARGTAALTSDTPFVERMVHFWANHFAVSADKQRVVPLAGAFEFEAIRPHVLGRFADMLHSVERHPAMLLFLDQARSVGPGSPAGMRAARNGRSRGLNENLAREILELHTLGVRTGYSQGDVTEFARALTGWTIGGRGAPAQTVEPGRFRFAPQLHQPGSRTLLGKTYGQAGEGQAAAVLDDLARHPATARHVATKLSRHFVGGEPPATMVERIETAFRRSDGDLPTVYRALIASPEAWAPAPTRFRTPWDWTLAALRATGVATMPGPALSGLLQQLGQPVWRPGSPAGYDDSDPAWAAPDALMRRVEAAGRLAARQQSAAIDARALATHLFPAGIDRAASTALSRAETGPQALALLFVSPAFLRR